MDTLTQTLDLTGWILLFIGWLLYWLKKLDELRKENKLKGVLDKTKWWNDFKSENILEVPISFISLFVLAILAAEIPPELIDMHGRISILAMGYANSSAVNGLITKLKR